MNKKVSFSYFYLCFCKFPYYPISERIFFSFYIYTNVQSSGVINDPFFDLCLGFFTRRLASSCNPCCPDSLWPHSVCRKPSDHFRHGPLSCRSTFRDPSRLTSTPSPLLMCVEKTLQSSTSSTPSTPTWTSPSTLTPSDTKNSTLSGRV